MTQKTPRLYDDICNFIIEDFEQIHCFVADDIQEFLDDYQLPFLGFEWSAEDYGRIAPPFSDFYIEAASRSRFLPKPLIAVTTGLIFHDVSKDIYLEGRRDTHENPPAHHAIPDNTYWALLVKGLRREIYDGGIDPISGVRPPKGPAWFLGNGVFFVHIDREGLILDKPRSVSVLESRLRPPDEFIRGRRIRYTATEIFVKASPMALMALGHLFKRETNIIELDPAAALKPKYRRKREAQGEVLHRHHILDLHPERGRYRAAGGTAGQGGKKAQHYRRGHWKWYGPDTPHVSGLIGGMYVSSSQVGAKQEGTVRKSYTIHKGKKS